jgi:hypothetical protein
MGFFLKLGGLVFISAIAIGYLNLNAPTFHEKNNNSPQVELKLSKSVDVLTPEGKLSHIGWSRTPEYFHFNQNKIRPSTSLLSVLNSLRYKKWEAFVFSHPEFILGTGIFDISILGGHMIHFSDLSKKGEIIFHEHLVPTNKPVITDHCLKNCLAAKHKIDGLIEYNQAKDSRLNNQKLKLFYNSTELKVDMDISIQGADYDSIVTLNPIIEDSTLFYYNIKTYLLKAVGTHITINGKKYDAKDIIITYDSGRGAWPIRSGWVWVSLNGKTKEGDNIGLNFGHGFNHPVASQHTEDSFFIGGKVYKLASVITKKVDSGEKQKWTFESEITETNKSKCSAVAVVDRFKENNMDFYIGGARFRVNYARFTGSCSDDEGKIHSFENLWGLVEDKLSIW